jgi:hypothetical protein
LPLMKKTDTGSTRGGNNDSIYNRDRGRCNAGQLSG